jgi:hypothetical protein
MSVANQANEKLAQLVSLAAKIEGHLSGGKKPNTGKQDTKTETAKGGGTTGGDSLSKDAAVIGGLSSSLSELIKSVDGMSPKAGDKLAAFILKMSNSVQEAVKNGLDADKVKELNENLGALVEGSAGFMKEMAKSIIYGIPAMIGAVFFGATLRILFRILQGVKGLNEDSRESIKMILDSAKGALLFGLGMAAYIIIGIPAMIGAALFGTTVLILSKILAKVSADKDQLEGVKALLDLAKGAALFALVMIGIGLMAQQVAIGALVFTLSVSAMLLIFGKIGNRNISGVKALLDLAKGAALFALTMIGIGFLAVPFAMGTIVFILAVSAMLLVFGKLTGTKVITSGLNAIFKMAKGAALFALVMVGIGFLAVPFAIGTLVFILAASAMLITFGYLSKKFPDAIKGARTLDLIFKSSLKFALAMIGIGFFATQFAIGALVFILAAGAMLFVFGALSKKYPDAIKGARALDTISKRIIPFTLALLVAGFFPVQVLLGAVAVSVAMFLVGFAAAKLGELNKKGDVTKGANLLTKLIAPMLGFSVALAILGAIPGAGPDLFIKIGAIAAAIVVLGLAAFGLGVLDTMPIPKAVTTGALVVLALAGAMIIMAGALYIISQAEFTMEKSINLGFAILTIGASFAAIGLISPFIALGAAAMLIASPVLLIMAGVFAILNAIDPFTKEDADALGYAIKTIGESFAWAGLLSIGIILGSVALIPAALSLLSLTPSLAIFKSIGWTKDDGVSLQDALQSVIQGFAHALDGVGIMGLFKIMAAIPLIGKIGTALASLAVGVKAMATLSFTEMEYDEKTGKLVPKREVRLTNEDIQAVGTNTAAILNALAQPLTEFGMWSTMGAVGFGPFTIGPSYMDKGIEQAMKIGGIITSLAEGVANMANLNVVDYEVVNAGTAKAKLVPKSSRKLTPVDFAMAAINTSLILNGIAQPLADFGRATESGEGFWGGDGYIAKGINAASKVSGIVTGLAEGVAKMANLEVTEYTVVNPGTKDAKLVPSLTRKLNPVDFALAAINVDLILRGIAQPLLDFGRMTESGEGWFSDGYLQKGIDAVAKVADPISKLADMVIKMAGGQATINEVVDDGKGGKKIVPKGVVSFADALPSAIEKTKQLLTGFAEAFFNFGYYVSENEDNFEYAEDFIPRFSDMMKNLSSASENVLTIAKSLTEAKDAEAKGGINVEADLKRYGGLLYHMALWGKLTDEENIKKLTTSSGALVKTSEDYLDIAKNFSEAQKLKIDPNPVLTNFATSIVKIGESFDKMNANKVNLYQKFTSITTGLTKIVTPFEKFVKLFGQFGKDMGYFVKVWETFGKDNADNLKSYADSLKTMSSVDPAKLKEITQALKEQALAQNQLNKANEGGEGQGNQGGGNQGGGNQGGNQNPKEKPQNTPSGKIIKVDAIYINNKEWRG